MNPKPRFVIQYRLLINGIWRRWTHDKTRQRLLCWEQEAYKALCPSPGKWCYFGSGKLLMRVREYRSKVR